MVAKQVLLVEDDSSIREQLRELLSDEGFVATEAANGREAMQHLQGGLVPHLIILDLMMPIMDGWHVLEALKAEPKYAGFPVIVATAGNDFRELEGVYCLRKPFTIQTVLDAVNANIR